MMEKLVLYLLLVGLTVQTGEGIKCYICSSSDNPNCAEHINKLEARECSTSGLGELYDGIKKGLKGLTMFLGTEVKQLDVPFACQKTVVSDEAGNSTVVRTCTIAKSEGLDPCSLTIDIEKMLKKNVKADYCDVCETDLCNGANHYSFNTFFITMSCFAASSILV